jgi:hypothetical protein
MNDTNKLIDECIDLATVMRPFIANKRGPVVMTTLCMLTAEAIVNTAPSATTEEMFRMVDQCIRDYTMRLEDASDDAP